MVGAILAPLAAILAGVAAGTAERSRKTKEKEQEITRQIMQKSAFERASKGDTGFADNPEMSDVLGKQGVQALLSYAQQIQQQNAQSAIGEQQARLAMHGGVDPLGGMAVGKHGGTMAGTGGGPTVTGGPGGSVSVQAPGTGRTVPSLAPAAPEALAQSVTGPAAGPADEEPAAGEPVPLPPMGPAAIPPQGAPAASAAPQTGLSRFQETLAPGQSSTLRYGGMSSTVRGLEAGEKADAIGRRIVSEGIKAKRRPDDMLSDVLEAGGKPPEGLKQYAEGVFTKGVRARLQALGGDIKSLSLQQKIAVTEEALEGGGSVTDAWKSMVGLTKDDEHQIAAEVVTQALTTGMPFWRAREYAAARGLRLSDADRVAMGRQAFGEAVTQIQTLEPGLSPEEVNRRAALVVQNNPDYIPPDVRASIREPAPIAAGTAAQITEEGGQQPRLSGAGQRTDVAGARQRAETGATAQAARTAGATEQAREDVPKTMPLGAQETLKGIDNAISLGQRIFAGYKPEYVGPAAARLDYLKEHFIDKSLPPGQVAFRANLHRFVNVAIFEITGKQLGSLTEAERIKLPIPNLNLPPAAFEERLSELRKDLNEKRRIEAGMARSQGYKAPPEAPTNGAQPAAPIGTPGYTGTVTQPTMPTKAPPSGKVWIQAPDGVWGSWDAKKPVPEGYRR